MPRSVLPQRWLRHAYLPGWRCVSTRVTRKEEESEEAVVAVRWRTRGGRGEDEDDEEEEGGHLAWWCKQDEIWDCVQARLAGDKGWRG